MTSDSKRFVRKLELEPLTSLTSRNATVSRTDVVRAVVFRPSADWMARGISTVVALRRTDTLRSVYRALQVLMRRSLAHRPVSDLFRREHDQHETMLPVMMKLRVSNGRPHKNGHISTAILDIGSKKQKMKAKLKLKSKLIPSPARKTSVIQKTLSCSSHCDVFADVSLRRI